MGGAATASGPDFSLGVRLSDIAATGLLAGRAGGEAVLLCRVEGELLAVSGACTHYGASLAEGLVDGSTIRCPLHHACFSLRTGAAIAAPALDPLQRWRVELDGVTVFVREKLPFQAPPARKSAVGNVVIAGAGAAGLACASELRALGFSGAITMLSEEADPPCDRPNLSKDYLAGAAPEEWIPLRSDAWYAEHSIELRLGTRVLRLDAERRTIHTEGGEDIAFDRLLLATGSEPNRLSAPGFDRSGVLTLRSLADARAVVGRARPGARAVVIGSSFIGLEAAAALRARGVEVDIVSLEKVPFERAFGAEVAAYFQQLHEANGVRFHLGTVASSFDGRSVRLVSGGCIAADFVLVGVGARPRTELARSAGLAIEDGVRVDAFLETSAGGIYCAGDLAAYPDPLTGERIRIQHWVTAQRQGQAAAANMLGLETRFAAVPFFWTEQYGVALRHVGHSSDWDEVAIDGDVAAGDFIARYFERGEHRASAAVGRDLEILEDERRFEQRSAGGPPAAKQGSGTFASACHPM